MVKKLIGFPDELIEDIEKYGESLNLSFTEAVRSLIVLGFQSQSPPEQEQGDAPDVLSRISELEQKVEKLSWWTSDDNTSRLGNLEKELEEAKKKLNIVVAVSKNFKGHLEDRDIHLQD